MTKTRHKERGEPAQLGLDGLVELAARLRAGELTLRDHVDELERRFTAREPEVRAFLPEEGRFARLRGEASDLLEQFPEPASRPPLFGVPVGVKDIFRVDGFVTRAGSRLPAAALAGEEAASVLSLRRAGALMLGKTATTEFAYFAPGPTRNPRALEHTPGGSSSGSAAAVAAGLCPLALGTQTIGSINRPAAFCGVVGFKPSYERVSRAGVIPLAPSLDHVGVFTADVAGAALAARVLIRDWHAAARPAAPVLAIPRGPYLEHASDVARDHLEDCRARLEAAGYRVREVIAFADFAAVRDRHQRLLAAEVARVHAEWYDRYRERYHPRTRALIEQGRPIGDGELAALCAARLELRRGLQGLMDRHRVDLWLTPSAPGPAPSGLESTGDPVMNLPWTQAGLPTVSVPAGDHQGLPLAAQLVGRFGADETLLAHAAAIAEVLAIAEPSR